MTLKSTMLAYDLLDSAYTTGDEVVKLFLEAGADEATTYRIEGDGFTDIVKIVLYGKNGKKSGGQAPTLNVATSLVAIGGRPGSFGIIGDGDGAIVSLAIGLKLLDMKKKGDQVGGDVIITLNINGHASTTDPVDHLPPYVKCPIDFMEMKKHFIDQTADAILNVNVTRSSQYCKMNGFAITPTVKEGWMLKVADDALNVMSRVTGKMPVVMPLTMQDLTPVCDEIFHLNDIGALPEGTTAPCLGVALPFGLPITASSPGQTDLNSLEPAVRFSIEVVKDYGCGKFDFYDEEEFQRLLKWYGPMDIFQTYGHRE